MKILFLDIDGVLNNTATFIHNRQMQKKYVGYSHRHFDEIDPKLLALVRHICEETGAKIVISSSWRILHTMGQIIEVFEAQGWKNPPVIDMTGRSDNGFRGQEVYNWIEGCESLTGYAILDDDGDFFPNQPLFRTDTRIGLTFPIAEEVIKHLRCC